MGKKKVSKLSKRVAKLSKQVAKLRADSAASSPDTQNGRNANRAPSRAATNARTKQSPAAGRADQQAGG